MKYDQAPEFYEDEQQTVRFHRRQRRSRWLWVALLAIVLPLLIGAGVAVFAGRPIAFDVVRRLTVRKFPQLRWIDPAGLAQWRADGSRMQPVVVDARTADEYAVSHLQGAVRMDPYRPSLRPLRGMAKDTAIVTYSTVGYRGARLANWLAGQGYNNVSNLSGSIFQWANEERPVFRNGNRVEEVHPYDGSWRYLLESRYRIAAPPVPKRSAAP